MHTVDSTNFYQALRVLLSTCRTDKRITPNTQLVYRVLMDLANRAFWAYPFEVSDSELKALTRIGSDKSITQIKRTLKNLGYIDFYGKPSKYTVYTPPARAVAEAVAHSCTPHTPQGNTYNTIKQNSKKEIIKKESEGARHDAKVSAADANNHELPPPGRGSETPKAPATTLANPTEHTKVTDDLSDVASPIGTTDRTGGGDFNDLYRQVNEHLAKLSRR